MNKYKKQRIVTKNGKAFLQSFHYGKDQPTPSNTRVDRISKANPASQDTKRALGGKEEDQYRAIMQIPDRTQRQKAFGVNMKLLSGV